MTKYIVAQTSFVEGPGKRLQVFNSLALAVIAQELWQNTTKDTIEIAEVLQHRWYVRLVLWVERKFGS